MYDAIRSEAVKQSFIHLDECEGKTAQKAREYVLDRLDKGVDWRKKVSEDIQKSHL